MTDWRHSFLQSKAWKHMRAYIMHRDDLICGHCGKMIFGTPIVHHKVELTATNYTDPAISLNPDLLMTVHHECHDEIHNRFGGRDKDTIVDEQLNIDYTRR